jgi:Family of unknown function (DUF6510)
MDDRDRRLDGNAAAGLLGEVFGFEMTAAPAGCAGCGAGHQVGALLAYRHGMGTVLCCPACQAVMVRVAAGGGRWWLDLRGAAFLQLDEGARLPG